MSGQWIAERLKVIGKRQADLSRETGIEPSKISKLIAGERRLQLDEVARVAAALRVSATQLMEELRDDRHAGRAGGRAGRDLAGAIGPERGDGAVDATFAGSDGRVYVVEAKGAADDLIPIRSGARGGDDQVMFLEDGPVGYTRRPPSLAGIRGAYALYAMGDSMSPRYEAGWLLFVNPFRPPRPGRDVAVEKTDGAVLIKQLLRRANGRIVLHSINPAYPDIELAESEIRHIHVITGSDQEGV